MNCIIVDDEVKNLNILTRLITDFCPDLIIQATAATVDTAFEKIIKHHPDIVFLDIEMPGGNAFSLLDKLMPTGASVPLQRVTCAALVLPDCIGI